MPYCVRCGVELDAGAKKCPLCSTPVIIPGSVPSEPSEPPYPDRLMLPPGIRKRYIAFLMSAIVLIPTVVCVIINILMPGTGLWSVYVASSAFIFWLYVTVPLMLKKVNPYLLLFFDTVGALIYAYVFFFMFRENGWYFKLAVPFILCFSLFCLTFIKWIRKRSRGKLQIIIILLADIALFSMIADVLINLYYGNERLFFVSIIVSVSCVCLIVFFRATEKNRRFKAWLTRRFYF